MSHDKKTTPPEDAQNKDAAVKPDPETLNTTDPQKNMEGPISSLMHKTGESFKTDQTKEEADEEKEEDME
ncbi:MAG: hypothetical protein ABIT96_11480 [Ferruginibacter sp.]